MKTTIRIDISLMETPATKILDDLFEQYVPQKPCQNAVSFSKTLEVLTDILNKQAPLDARCKVNATDLKEFILTASELDNTPKSK